jgi:hypothetical protein
MKVTSSVAQSARSGDDFFRTHKKEPGSRKKRTAVMRLLGEIRNLHDARPMERKAPGAHGLYFGDRRSP